MHSASVRVTEVSLHTLKGNKTKQIRKQTTTDSFSLCFATRLLVKRYCDPGPLVTLPQSDDGSTSIVYWASERPHSAPQRLCAGDRALTEDIARHVDDIGKRLNIERLAAGLPGCGVGRGPGIVEGARVAQPRAFGARPGRVRTPGAVTLAQHAVLAAQEPAQRQAGAQQERRTQRR